MREGENILLSALYYGINKAISEVLGPGGMVVGRRASKEMVNFLKDEGILKDNMSFDDIKKLYVNEFELSEDLSIEDNGKEVIFTIIKPTLTIYREKMKDEKIEPYVSPFIYLLADIYEKINNGRFKLTLKQVDSQSDSIKVVFKKINC
ncbi:conserved protein of unknown function [Methanocaldococcus lauensis]|nr:conserved protein of unknown function [Methanocaldococcus lauensis]